MIRFEGDWKPLIPLMAAAVKNDEELIITLTQEEYKKLKQYEHLWDGDGSFNYHLTRFSCDIPEEILARLELLKGETNEPELLVTCVGADCGLRGGISGKIY